MLVDFLKKEQHASPSTGETTYKDLCLTGGRLLREDFVVGDGNVIIPSFLKRFNCEQYEIIKMMKVCLSPSEA